MDFYERLTKLMNERGLSQGKLEKELGFSNGSVSKWAKSMPNADRLGKLAKYFNVSVEYLKDGEEPKFSKDRAILEVQITEDAELMKRLKKYMELSQEKKDLIINMIDNL